MTSRSFLCAALLALSALPTAAAAQGRDDEAAREQAFVEVLRREDPASADRFTALRAAQRQAVEDLRKTEGRANAMPPELRASFLPQLKQARKKFAETQIKVLDFLDERDRKVIARLEGDIEQFKRALEDRQKARDDLNRIFKE